MVSGSSAVFLLFAVVGALVLGTTTGAGKGEMMCLHNQSDVTAGEQMIGAQTM